MKSTKKLFALLLSALMLAGVLAACGNNGGTEAPAADDGASAEEGGANSSVEPADDAEVITFWHLFSGDEAQMLQNTVDKFNEANPDVYVEVLEGTTAEKQLVAISGGTPPDVAQIMDTDFPKMANAGMATDLTSYFADAGVDIDNFHSSALELCYMNGTLYGAPFTMDSFLMFYNIDILEELGYSEPPTTIEELAQICLEATITDDNGDYERVGMTPSWPWHDVPNLPYHFGGSFYDFETNTVTANSPENVEALEFKASFYNDPYDADAMIKFISGFGQYQSAENPFFNGKIAFAFEGEWYPTFIEQYAPDLNYGIASIPVAEGREDLVDVCRLQGAVIYMPENGDKKDAAFRFLNYMVSDEAQLDFNIAKGGLPITMSALNDSTLVEGNPNLEPFVELVKKEAIRAFPAVPFASEYFDELYNQEELVYTSGASAQDVLDAVAEKIQPLADEWAAEQE